MRAALLHRQPAVAVGQRLGGAAEALLGPGGFGERAVGVEVTVRPVTSTLRAASQCRRTVVVVQPGVVGGHLRRVVVEDAAHDFLRNVAVDQPGASVCRHWCGVKCTGWPCSSRTSQRLSQR